MNHMKNGDSFITSIESKGYKIRVSKIILNELKDIANSVKSGVGDNDLAKKALELFGDHKRFKRVDMGHGPTNESLIAKSQEGFFIGTLDKEVNRRITNKLVI
mgnify:FL=1